ncbi:MAG: cytidylate kinase-like family protein [Deltaproteobacteria bacterium]|nr:cytidylate kinase-like family protein [Deltaproteobacteria bacterium]
MTTRISELIDRQVKLWRLQQRETGERSTLQSTSSYPVITTSSSVAALGQDVARIAADALDLPLYDREIVEQIAKREHVEVDTVAALDERAEGALEDYLTALFREHTLDQSDYFRGLCRTIAALWSRGSCVFVGRGAGFIVSPGRALRVRFDAPVAVRIARVQHAEKIGADAARRLVERGDAERQAFIRHFFARDVNDPLGYDLTINTATMDVEDAVATVLTAFTSKFLEA